MIFDQDKITDPGILQLIKVNGIDFNVLGPRLDVKIQQCARSLYTFYAQDTEMTREWLFLHGYKYEGHQPVGSMKQDASFSLFSKNDKNNCGLQVLEKDAVIMVLLVDSLSIELLKIMQKTTDVRPIIYLNGNITVVASFINGLNLAHDVALMHGKHEAEVIEKKESIAITQMRNEIEQKNKAIAFLTEQSEVFKELSETQRKMLKLLEDLPSVKRKLKQT